MDAESQQIESYRAEIARLKKWNLMTDEQVVMDLKAEIERLKANIIWLEARNKALTEMRLEDKACITRLCEALECHNLDHLQDDLIQQGRMPHDELHYPCRRSRLCHLLLEN